MNAGSIAECDGRRAQEWGVEGGAQSTEGRAVTATERQGDRRKDWHVRGFAATSGTRRRRAWGRGHWAEERARRLEAAPPRLDVPVSAGTRTEVERRPHGVTIQAKCVDVRGEGCVREECQPVRDGRGRKHSPSRERPMSMSSTEAAAAGPPAIIEPGAGRHRSRSGGTL